MFRFCSHCAIHSCSCSQTKTFRYFLESHIPIRRSIFCCIGHPSYVESSPCIDHPSWVESPSCSASTSKQTNITSIDSMQVDNRLTLAFGLLATFLAILGPCIMYMQVRGKENRSVLPNRSLKSMDRLSTSSQSTTALAANEVRSHQYCVTMQGNGWPDARIGLDRSIDGSRYIGG